MSPAPLLLDRAQPQRFRHLDRKPSLPLQGMPPPMLAPGAADPLGDPQGAVVGLAPPRSPTRGGLLELVDIEMTTFPLMVFFCIGVREVREGQQHHVNKRYVDLADFHKALERELAAGKWVLPQLPGLLSEKDMASPSFRGQMSNYLARLGRCPEALQTYSFKNFFQLSDDYQRFDKHENTLLLKCPPPAPASNLDGAAAGALHQRRPSLPGAGLSHRMEDISSSPGHVAAQQPLQQRADEYFRVAAHSPGGRGLVARASSVAAPVGGAAAAFASARPVASDAARADGFAAEMSLPSSEGRLRPSGSEAHEVASGRPSLPTMQRAEVQQLLQSELRRDQHLAARAPPQEAPAAFRPNGEGIAGPWAWSPSIHHGGGGGGAGAGMWATAAPQVHTLPPRAAPSEDASMSPTSPGSIVPPLPQPKQPEVSAQSLSMSSDAELMSSADPKGGARRVRRRPWCVICMAKPQEVAIDPCGHLSMCHSCAGAVQACPMCRGPILKALRVYIS